VVVPVLVAPTKKGPAAEVVVLVQVAPNPQKVAEADFQCSLHSHERF
jgi:hypothetical protein